MERKDLKANEPTGQPVVTFMHHPFAALKTNQAELRRLVGEYDTRLVLYGHIHYNYVINTGKSTQIATASLKHPFRNNPKGYALVTVDEGKLAWHFVPLDQRPVIALANPSSRLMTSAIRSPARRRGSSSAVRFASLCSW